MGLLAAVHTNSHVVLGGTKHRLSHGRGASAVSVSTGRCTRFCTVPHADMCYPGACALNTLGLRAAAVS